MEETNIPSHPRPGAKIHRGQRTPNTVRSSETRAALVQATIDCLCRLGYSGTTTTEISRSASISTGALQHHYGTKDELIIASLDQLMLDMRSKLDLFAQSQGTAEQKCRAFVDIMWNQFYHTERYLAVWEIVVGARSEAELHKRVMQHREQSLEACKTIWCDVFNIKSHDDHPSIEAMKFALSFMRGAAFTTPAETLAANIEMQLSFLVSVLVNSFSATNTKRRKSK